MKVIPLTCALGAELKNVNLADAARDDSLFAEIRALLLEHKVLFLRDQDISDAEHAAFARRFGELEDHPLTNSVEGEPGIIHIWKTPDSPPERYENAWHNDATWREMVKFVEFGVSPMETIQSATLWPARFLKRAQDYRHALDLLAAIRPDPQRPAFHPEPQRPLRCRPGQRQ